MKEIFVIFVNFYQLLSTATNERIIITLDWYKIYSICIRKALIKCGWQSIKSRETRELS